MIHRGAYESLFWRQKSHCKFVSVHLINYRRAYYDRSMDSATLAENAIISVLDGQHRRSAYLRKAHKHSRNDGVIGAAAGAVLADSILEATRGSS